MKDSFAFIIVGWIVRHRFAGGGFILKQQGSEAGRGDGTNVYMRKVPVFLCRLLA